VADFAHYRPVISVDDTFLTRKNKGTLMVAVGMTTKNQLLSLAFALVEGENNESWKWFLGLVRKQVIGPNRQVCMISDHHRGLLNGAKDHLKGYPPFIHRRCSRHFAANIWKKQQSKEVIVRLKALCKIKEEKKFEATLKELEKILKYNVNAWLFEQLPRKSKWALAFDEGGSRYGIMTTNISEVFNFVLKCIRSLPISGIVDYTIHKCNEYFMSRWEKARQSLVKGELWGGNLQENTFLNRSRYQIMKLSCCLIPRSLCTRLSHQAGLVLVVRYQEDAYFELRSTLL
jgi:transposase-like protein